MENNSDNNLKLEVEGDLAFISLSGEVIKTYDLKNNYSPVGSDRGERSKSVIGIDSNGTVDEEIISGNPDCHAFAAGFVIDKLTDGAFIDKYPYSYMHSFLVGSFGTIYCNIMIIMLEGDAGLIYFPSNITEKQFNSLLEVIKPRDKFTFSFIHGEHEDDFKTADEIKDYARGMVVSDTMKR